MELKRILARDTRSATEQALARFGPNVFVISNQRLAGQTELVVAVDVEAALPHEDEVRQPTPEAPVARSFRESYESVQQHASPSALSEPTKAETLKQAAPTQAENDRELIRSREIVATVREEIASLRQEFRISQKALLWQAEQTWPAEIAPLVQGLSEASVPASLRTLLLDMLRDQTHLGTAIDGVVQHLVSNVTQQHVEVPSRGIHILAGPSGSGKTTMTARLVRHALQTLHPEQVAVISFRDHRAGAWAQTQTLSAQLGIDCFRARDADMLTALLNELSQRELVWIDTPGAQMPDNMAMLRGLCPAAQWHAVVPADVSAVTLQRVLGDDTSSWCSLMVSKLDESSSPWPLLQHLMQSPARFGLSMASGSERIEDGLQSLSSALLAELAVAQWMPQTNLSQGLAQAIIEPTMELH